MPYCGPEICETCRCPARRRAWARFITPMRRKSSPVITVIAAATSARRSIRRFAGRHVGVDELFDRELLEFVELGGTWSLCRG